MAGSCSNTIVEGWVERGQPIRSVLGAIELDQNRFRTNLATEGLIHEKR